MNRSGRGLQPLLTALFVLSSALVSSATLVLASTKIAVSATARHAEEVFQRQPGNHAEKAPQKFDVEHLRLQLDIEPYNHLVRGQMWIQFRTIERDQTAGEIRGNDSVRIPLILPTRGLKLTRALFHSEEDINPVSVSVIDTTDFPELVNRLDSTTVEFTGDRVFSLLIEFEIYDGLISFPLGRNAGAWSSVRSLDLFERRHWIPFPIGINDQFSGEFRITVPGDWVTVLTGKQGPTLTSDDRQTSIVYLDSTSVVTDLAFVTYSQIDSDLRAITVESDSSFATDIGQINLFLEHLGGRTRKFLSGIDSTASSPETSTHDGRQLRFVTSINQLHPSALSTDLYLLPDPGRFDPANPYLPEQTLARTGADDWVNSNIRFSAPTDRWLYPALSSYLAGEYIRETLGNAVYTAFMWRHRDLYFDSEKGSLAVLDSGKQSSMVGHRQTDGNQTDAYGGVEANIGAPYASPIVEARGVWVLRMLSDRISRDSFSLALRKLVALSRTQPVSTEDFRRVLEDASGESLGRFFDAWIYGPGHPRIEYSYTVKASQDAINVDISQVQDQLIAVDFFEVDSQLQISSLAGVDSAIVRLRGPVEHLVVPVSLRPQFVLFDPLARILYEPAVPLSTELLISGLRRSTEVAGQMAILHQLRNRKIEPAHLLGLRSVLSTQLSDPVRAQLVEILGGAAPSNAAMRELVAAAESESPGVHAAALRGLSRFDGSSEARSLALSAANSSQNPLVLSAAVEALVQLDSTLSLAVLKSAMVTNSDDDHLRREAIKTMMQSRIDHDEKWSLLQPLLSNETHPETRLAALESMGSFMQQPDERKEVLSRWPLASAPERRTTLELLEQMVRPGELTTDETRTFQLWLQAEPESDLRRRLKEYIPIRQGILTIHP